MLLGLGGVISNREHGATAHSADTSSADQYIANVGKFSGLGDKVGKALAVACDCTVGETRIHTFNDIFARTYLVDLIRSKLDGDVIQIVKLAAALTAPIGVGVFVQILARHIGKIQL